MRTVQLWAQKVVGKDGERHPVHDVAFHPHGTLLAACSGALLHLFDVQTGEPTQTLKGHRGTVYAVDFSADGKLLASGGSDKVVILWGGERLEPLWKYSHGDSVQAVAFCPISNYLVSCSLGDFAFWSPETRAITKHKMPSRTTCCAWSSNGHYVALGLFSGVVSIRDKAGEECARIERGSAPVWSLCWKPAPTTTNAKPELLAVTDFHQKLSFYYANGEPAGKEVALSFDPLSVAYLNGGEMMMVGGSDRSLHLYNADGVHVNPICETSGWVWACKARPKTSQHQVAVATEDGLLSLHQINFSVIHALYEDVYAYRNGVAEIIIQQLTGSNTKIHLTLHDYVKKMSIYRDNLAVQLSDRIVLFVAQKQPDSETVHYHLKETIRENFTCNLLVVTSENLVLCQDHKLVMYSLQGKKEREWQLDALIRYIKALGGPKGREGLLVGLKNGQTVIVYLDNPFPLQLVKLDSCIRCLDLSLSRKKLAAIDDTNTLFVYDLRSKALLYQEANASSVAWNTEADDMLAFSGNGTISIKSGQLPCFTQKQQGFVIGFKGSKLYCLSSQSTVTVDIPHTTTLQRYLERKEFQRAYEIACLGVTDRDWKILGTRALEEFHLDVARKCFIRLRDLKLLDLIDGMEKLKVTTSNATTIRDLLLAELNCYQGNFHEAARLYRKANQVHRAMEMYTDLHMWEDAKKMAQEEQTNVSEVLLKKAQSEHEKNDLAAAAETYIEVGDFQQAIDIYGQNRSHDKIIELARRLHKMETKALAQCVAHFRKNKQLEYAAEILTKMGDIRGLIELRVELQQFEEAFQLAEVYPDMRELIFLPYAHSLALEDRFLEAQTYFRKAGRVDLALDVMQRLANNAVEECRFSDAAFYHWALAKEYLNGIPDDRALEDLSEQQGAYLAKFYEYQRFADFFYAYSALYGHVHQPFTAHLSESIFHMARQLLHASLDPKQSLPPSISMALVLFALAKQSRALGAHRLARYAYDRLLRQYPLPSAWRNTAETGWIAVRAKPLADPDEIAPVCYQCSTINPPLRLPRIQKMGGAEDGELAAPEEQYEPNRCTSCKAPFVKSSHTYDNVPLVEFHVEHDVSVQEAKKLIHREPSLASVAQQPEQDRWQAEDNSLKMVSEPAHFTPLSSHVPGIPLYSRAQLSELSSTDVFVQDYKKRAIPARYFRNVLPEVPVTMCATCFRFFHTDDYEYLVLQNFCCPFCRAAVDMDVAR